jgi:hypothetical protein
MRSGAVAARHDSHTYSAAATTAAATTSAEVSAG